MTVIGYLPVICYTQSMLKRTWQSNAADRLRHSLGGPQRLPGWRWALVAFADVSEPPSVKGSFSPPSLMSGRRGHHSPIQGCASSKDLARRKCDLIEKGYGKQINDILMNFSTQFEKPCYVNHNFQLPSRKKVWGKLRPL